MTGQSALPAFQEELDRLEDLMLQQPVAAETELRELLTPLHAPEFQSEHARAMTLLGGALFNQGRYEAALPVIESALSEARALNDPTLISRSLNGLGLTEQQCGRYTEAFEHYQESLKYSLELRDVLSRARTLSNMSSLLLAFRQPQAALDYLEEAQGILLRHQHPTATLVVSANLMWTHLDIGNYRQALSIANLFSPMALESGLPSYLVSFHSARAMCYLHLGYLREALASAQKAVECVAEHPGCDPEAMSHYTLGLIEMAQRRYDEAEVTLLRALEVSEATGSVNTMGDVSLSLARLYRKRHEEDKAHAYGLKFFQLQGAVGRAALARAPGDVKQSTHERGASGTEGDP